MSPVIITQTPWSNLIENTSVLNTKAVNTLASFTSGF